MTHSRYIPSHPLLKNIVRYFAFQPFDGTGNSNHWMTLFPNCTTNLCIVLDSCLVTNESSKINNSISTSCISPVTFSRCHSFELIVIQLEPYGFHSLVGLPMKHYKNSFLKLDDFFTLSELDKLYNQLYETKNSSLRVKLLEDFLLTHLQQEQVDGRVLFATRQIHRNPNTQLDEIIKYLNISARRLRDLFSTHLGISPKHYSRLSRFNHVTARVTNNKSSLTEIALATGYFDQAHFIREFREFGGLSPNQFRKLSDKNAEFYNFEKQE
jgi:AraC-like DNA-binding protein